VLVTVGKASGKGVRTDSFCSTVGSIASSTVESSTGSVAGFGIVSSSTRY
jgi:hypothetical protein